MIDKDVYQHIAKIDPLHNSKFQNMDEINFGRLFAETFKDVLLFNTTAGQWYFYDGILWAEDSRGMKTEGLAQMFARALRVYVAQNMSDNPTHFENEYLKYSNTLGNRSKRQRMIDDAKNLLLVKGEDFDTDKYLLNVQNGVIDLSTMTLLPHDPSLLLSKVCNASYYMNAHSDRWSSFLDEVLEGDQEKKDYLQRVIGTALIGDNRYEDFFILHGEKTRNGKTTLVETLQNVMGSYASTIQPESLALRKRDGRQASGDIARLKGIRVVFCSEPQKGMILDISQIKLLTGVGTVTARNLYEKEIQFRPICTLFMDANSLPVINDMTLFDSDRVKVIEFNRHFSEAERDVSLKDKLVEPQCLSAVLNWCLEGLVRCRQIGRQMPESVRQATTNYRTGSDKIQMYIDECLQPCETSNTQFKLVYQTYKRWCTSNGFMAESKKTFRQVFSAKIPIAPTGTVSGVTCKNVILGYTFTPEGFDVQNVNF